MYSLCDYHYTLPPELIAQEAIHPHHDARLMVIDKTTGAIVDESTFWNLESFIPRDRVIFFNNSRVLRARIRLEGVAITQSDGATGTIEHGEILFCQKQVDGSFEALVRPGKKYRVGTKIHLGDAILEVVGISEHGRYLRASGNPIEEIMELYGELPLPPYITYTKEKEEDYQTSFAQENGSVAAPTASLHFTRELMAKLSHKKEYITLHVGLGTFQGVDTADIRDYQIHSEMISIDIGLFESIYLLQKNAEKILAVGTTVCRSLESLPYLWQGLSMDIRESIDTEVGEWWDTLTESLEQADYIHSVVYEDVSKKISFATTIYIYPGKRFLLVDDLITNFHLPESSLLMLVSAFVGYETTIRAYQRAIEQKYRFFSFGDGMYIRDMREK